MDSERRGPGRTSEAFWPAHDTTVCTCRRVVKVSHAGAIIYRTCRCGTAPTCLNCSRPLSGCSCPTKHGQRIVIGERTFIVVRAIEPASERKEWT